MQLHVSFRMLSIIVSFTANLQHTKRYKQNSVTKLIKFLSSKFPSWKILEGRDHITVQMDNEERDLRQNNLSWQNI